MAKSPRPYRPLPQGAVRSRPRAKHKRRWLLTTLLALPVLWLGYRSIGNALAQPQAILVLGGAPEREDFAAEFAQQHPNLPIWISSGSNVEYTEDVFATAGIDFQRLHIDRAAVDTVTNFTTLVDELKARNIRSVYLITSDYHMRRAKTIGEIVFGSRGIYFQSVSVPSTRHEEPVQKAVRDGARALLWVTTGYTGSTLSHHLGDR